MLGGRSWRCQIAVKVPKCLLLTSAAGDDWRRSKDAAREERPAAHGVRGMPDVHFPTGFACADLFDLYDSRERNYYRSCFVEEENEAQRG